MRRCKKLFESVFEYLEEEVESSCREGDRREREVGMVGGYSLCCVVSYPQTIGG